MKNYTHIIALLALAILSSCNTYNKLLKSTDYDEKYEAAKRYYTLGEFSKASTLLGEQVAMLKGTGKGEECLYLLGMSEFGYRDYESAANYLRKYYQTYPNGRYADEARYHSGLALFRTTPDPRLDQTTTIGAINELQNFLDFKPNTPLKLQTQDMIFALQDKLVEKEYYNAREYYDLGSYFGNCSYGGNNYQACIVTSQNAIKEYPYMSHREDFAILILRSKLKLAEMSIAALSQERYRDTVDEYYAFINEHPESRYLDEAKKIFNTAEKHIIKNQKKYGLQEN